jgi:uncharacterized RDD family membrane protein YckC
MFIDSITFITVTLLLLDLLQGSTHVAATVSGQGQSDFRFDFKELLIDWLLPCLITVVCWLRFQGTPGKLLMSCQVVDIRTGGPIGLRQALLRYLGYAVSALPLGLGFLWILWDRRRQGFHDKIAGTAVVIEDESKKALVQLLKELR